MPNKTDPPKKDEQRKKNDNLNKQKDNISKHKDNVSKHKEFSKEKLETLFLENELGELINALKGELTAVKEDPLLIYGPLIKNEHTKQYEDLLNNLINGKEVNVKQHNNEYHIELIENGQVKKTYNLNKILKYANLEHIEISAEDLKKYKNFITTINSWVHLMGSVFLQDRSGHLPPQQAVSNLEVIERQQINLYTTDYYQEINYFLRGDFQNLEKTLKVGRDAFQASEASKQFWQNIAKENQEKINPMAQASLDEGLTKKNQELITDGKADVKTKLEDEEPDFGPPAESKVDNVNYPPEHAELLGLVVRCPLIVSALNKLPDIRIDDPNFSVRGEKYRSKEELEARIKAMKEGIGGVTMERGFISATTRPEATLAFGSNIRIVFSNLIGKDISSIAEHRSEQEFLIPPIQIAWKNFKEEDGIYYVHAQPVRTLTGLPTEDTPKKNQEELEKIRKNANIILNSITNIENIYKEIIESSLDFLRNNKRVNQIKQWLAETREILENYNDVTEEKWKRMKGCLSSIQFELDKELSEKNKSMLFRFGSLARLKEEVDNISKKIGKMDEAVKPNTPKKS